MTPAAGSQPAGAGRKTPAGGTSGVNQVIANAIAGRHFDVILFDGMCGLCDRFVSFVLARDARTHFHFSAQQSPWAARRLQSLGIPTAGPPQTVVVLTADGRRLDRSAAVFYVLARLGGLWAVLAWLRLLPRWLTNTVYDFIARRRYRWFGKRETCRMPSPAERARFLVDEA